MDAVRSALLDPIARLAVIWAMTVLLTGMLPSAGANPLPPGGTWFHVHPVDPQFCNPCPITQCEQIVQHTAATGVLEFDLFVDHLEFYYQGVPVYAFNCPIVWDSAWTLLEYEICGGGSGQLIPVAANRADLEAVWPTCPFVQDRIWPVARFVFEAPALGQVDAVWDNLFLTLGCPPNLRVESGLVTSPGVAGVVCDVCDYPCSHDQPCRAEFVPSTYEVHLLPGESTQLNLHAEGEGHFAMEPCSATITDDADWLEPLSGSASWQGWGVDVDIPVSIDATGLAPGAYQAWVRAESDCVGCARINLIVGESQGVSEGDGTSPTSPSPGVPISWGRLKELHR